MEMKQKGVLHNEFLIEVIDANTKEIKGQYKAYNIILDQLFTRLMNISSYFTSIHFGTGTGELDRTRTSLFSFLGAKGASVVSETSRVDLSDVKVQRVIQIMPEEYVGSVITEVGVGFGTTATNLCTHAFILDSQGNPVGITKSSTDVINIYATVYITYETGHPNITISNDNNIYGFGSSYINNPLTSILIRQSSGLSSMLWHLGRGKSDSSPGEKFIEKSFASSSTSLGTSSWTKDLEKRTLTSAKIRFDVNSGNGNIYEIGLAGFMRARLPIPGVWEGYHFENKPLGIGDGIKKEFIVTSVESPRPGSIVIKSNEVIKSSGFKETHYFNGSPELAESFYDGSSYDRGYRSYGAFSSRDRKIMMISDLSLDWNGNSPSTKVYNIGENGRSLYSLKTSTIYPFYYGDIRHDNRFVATSTYATSGTMNAYLYRVVDIEKAKFTSIGGDVGLNSLAEGESATTGSGQGICFSRDGKFLFTSFSTSKNSILSPGRLFKYISEGDTYERVNIDYGDLNPSSTFNAIRVTVDNKYFIVTTKDIKNGNNLIVFEIGENGIKAVAKDILFDSCPPIDSNLSNLVISDDGSVLILPSAKDKIFYIYRLEDGKYFLKQELPSNSPGQLNGIDISPNNKYICFIYNTKPYLIELDENGEYKFMNNNSYFDIPAVTGVVYTGVQFSHRSDRIWLNSETEAGTSGDYDTYLRIFSISNNETKIIFDTPPAEEEVLTFDCDVDYIPKDTNSVLDLQATIQFSDANETT